jgi:integrase
MFDLKEYIKHKRSTLSDSSIVTYYSILKNLYKSVFGDEDIDPKNFDDSTKILAHLKDLPPNRRKTILSALVVVTSDKAYRDVMLNDIKEYNTSTGTQEKTESQKKNWVDDAEIKSTFDTLKKNADLLYKKTTLTQTDFQHIQSYIIMALLGGIFIPPRRSLDYCDFKTKDIDKTKNNYLDKDTFVFNTYKTSKTYGEQRVVIPKELKTILTKWIKTNPSDYLLFDTNNNSLNAVKLNQRFNKIFDGKKISINAMRHAYLTGKYASTIEQNEKINDDMTAMGSSIGMLKTYVKKD